MMMKKLLSLKNLSQKLPKSSNSLSSSSRPFHSLSKASSFLSPPPPPPPHHYQWRSPSSNAICGSLSKFVLSKHFVSCAHFKGQLTSSLGSRVGFLSTKLPKIKGSPLWSSSQRRSWNSSSRGYSADGVVYGLILANAGVFILWRVLPRDVMYKNFTISVDNFKSGRIHTLLTSAFSHIDMEHIASNMIGLYFFGSSIGNVFGPEYLLKLYVAGAVVGSIFFLVHHAYLANTSKRQGTFSRNPSKTPGLGASGAVNAILLLDIFLFPKKTLMFDFFIPVPAILLGIFLVGKDVLRALEGDQQMSGSAHLGGAAVAAVAWLRLKRRFRF